MYVRNTAYNWRKKNHNKPKQSNKNNSKLDVFREINGCIISCEIKMSVIFYQKLRKDRKTCSFGIKIYV